MPETYAPEFEQSVFRMEHKTKNETTQLTGTHIRNAYSLGLLQYAGRLRRTFEMPGQPIMGIPGGAARVSRAARVALVPWILY